MSTFPRNCSLPGRGYQIPGIGLLPFGTQQVRQRQPHLLPARARPADAGHHRVRLDARRCRQPMTLDELRESVRRVLGVDVPVEPPAGSRATCAAPHRRAEQPTGRALPRRAGLLGRRCRARALADGRPGSEPGHAGRGQPRLETGRRGERLGADGLLDTYESERYPVGERVMMHSRRRSRWSAPGPEIAALRELFGELASKPRVADTHRRPAGGLRRPLRRRQRPPAVGATGARSGLDDGRRVAELLHDARAGTARPVRRCGRGRRGRWADRVDVSRQPRWPKDPPHCSSGPTATSLGPQTHSAPTTRSGCAPR